jgi:hypothetical protein
MRSSRSARGSVTTSPDRVRSAQEGILGQSWRPASSRASLEVPVAHERLTLRPQQLSPAQERRATVFTTPVPMSGITAAIPYRSCALARMTWRRRIDHGVRPGLWQGLLLAMVALIFSLALGYRPRNTGEGWYLIWGPFLMVGAAGRVGVRVYPAESGPMSAPPER